MMSRRLIVLAAIFMAAVTASAQTHFMSDADAIRHVMKATWDKPAATVDVSPVVVVSDYAIAGWTQDINGGRALLRRKNGTWTIILCAGDQLRDAEILQKTGMSEADARRLAADLAQAEKAVAPARVAMFSRFEGMVTMDAGSHAH